LNINLADAQRQENLGNARGAIAAEDQARKDRADVLRATTARDKAIADLAASGVRLNMPRNGAGAGAAAPRPNPTIYSIEAILGGLKEEHAGDPTWTPAKLKSAAVAEYNRQTKTSDIGPEKRGVEDTKLKNAQDVKVIEAEDKAKKALLVDIGYQKLKGKDKETYAANKIKEAVDSARASFGSSVASGGNSKTPPPPSGFIQQ